MKAIAKESNSNGVYDPALTLEKQAVSVADKPFLLFEDQSKF